MKLPKSADLKTLLALKNPPAYPLPADCDCFYNQRHAPLRIEEHGAFGSLGHESLGHEQLKILALAFTAGGLNHMT